MPHSTGFVSFQLNAVRFLVEERAAEVNQVDAASGQTPLHRAARMAHYTGKPYFEVRCAVDGTVHLLRVSCICMRLSPPEIDKCDTLQILEYLLEQGADPSLTSSSLRSKASHTE